VFSKPGVFGVAPGACEVTIMKPYKQAVYSGIVPFALYGLEIFGQIIYVVIGLHFCDFDIKLLLYN